MISDDDEKEYSCPKCDANIPVDIDAWQDLFLWNGVCPHCGTEVQMENDFDTEGGGNFWLIEMDDVVRKYFRR
jgi:hypothetical protein